MSTILALAICNAICSPATAAYLVLQVLPY